VAPKKSSLFHVIQLSITTYLSQRGSLTMKKATSISQVTPTGATHSFSQEEKEAFCDHINEVLKNDPHLTKLLPVSSEGNALFDACKDGRLLCKLINDAVPDTIDERVMNLGDKLNAFQMTENNNLCINSAKAIGCSVVNIGSQDIIEGREHLILGLIWQIVRIGLMSKITLTNHPELYRLLEPGEDINDLLKLPPEQILLRWLNYHLKNAGSDRRVSNFSSDIKDSVVYTIVMNRLVPDKCDKEPLNESDLTKRAEMVLKNAEKIGCRKFLKARDIVNGNPKLNLAFVANLFNTYPGLEPLTQEELAKLEEWLFASEGTREARAFALWMNSLGVEPFVNNLFNDLRDGLVLLRVMDKIEPGIVEWNKVNQQLPLNRFKMIENCNYAVDLGKKLKFSLVGIGGVDIVDGNKTLTLALVWQMMRHHVLSILKSLKVGGKEVTEEDMIKWANEQVAKSGKSSRMQSFKDPTLRTGIFFLELLDSIRRCVNWEIVTKGETDQDATQNAKYAISIARKLGATIFLLPEDIVEVKPKMILTFVGAVMYVALKGQ
jgi:plastin-1